MENYFKNLKDIEIKINKAAKNCRYFKKNQKFSLHDLKPQGLCLAAFHSLIPYIYTLHNKGRFSWMKDRKKVIAQCPNPLVCVAFEVAYISGSKFKISVVQIKGKCPEGHKTKDSFNIDLEKLNFCYKASDALFPSIFEYLFNKGINGTKKISCAQLCSNAFGSTIFQIDKADKNKAGNFLSVCDTLKKQEIRAIKMDRTCRRYHLFPKKKYSQRIPVPKNFCMEAFHVCYPSCLAMSYGAFNTDSVILKCPGTDNSIKLKIFRKKSLISPFIRIVENGLRFIKRPTDIQYSKVYIQVVGQKGKCPKNLKLGDIISFPSFSNDILCPAAFDSLFPSMILLDKGILNPWSNNSACIAQCPDHLTNVNYKLKKVG